MTAARVAILGAGAIGGLFAARLSGIAPVGLLLRPGQPAPPSPATLQLTDLSGRQQHCNLPWLGLDQLAQLELLVVTVKAGQVQGALEPFKDKLPHRCAILLLHNGVGPQYWVREQFAHHPLLWGTTANGALLQGPLTVRHTGAGLTLIGPANQAAAALAPLASRWDQVLPPCQWQEEIEQALWTKLVINCAINPLTARDSCRNGQLADVTYEAEIRALVTEAVAVLNRLGACFQVEKMIALVQQVIAATSANYSSMNRDIHFGRPTEIDWINGFIVEKGQQLGIEVSANQACVQAIKQIERTRTQGEIR